jgi:hypothetical protein
MKTRPNIIKSNLHFLRATMGSNASFPPEWLQLQLSKFDLPYLTLDVANLRLTLVRPAL